MLLRFSERFSTWFLHFLNVFESNLRMVWRGYGHFLRAGHPALSSAAGLDSPIICPYLPLSAPICNFLRLSFAVLELPIGSIFEIADQFDVCHRVSQRKNQIRPSTEFEINR